MVSMKGVFSSNSKHSHDSSCILFLELLAEVICLLETMWLHKSFTWIIYTILHFMAVCIYENHPLVIRVVRKIVCRVTIVEFIIARIWSCIVHSTVSCGPRKLCVLNTENIFTWRTKLQFSCICSSMFNLNGPKFTVEVPSTQVKPHSKFEENSYNHYWDVSN